MFEGFTRTEIATSGARIHLRHGGDGPPLLLLHGNPLTHISWHKIANRLAERPNEVGRRKIHHKRGRQAIRAAIGISDGYPVRTRIVGGSVLDRVTAACCSCDVRSAKLPLVGKRNYA